MGQQFAINCGMDLQARRFDRLGTGAVEAGIELLSKTPPIQFITALFRDNFLVIANPGIPGRLIHFLIEIIKKPVYFLIIQEREHRRHIIGTIRGRNAPPLYADLHTAGNEGLVQQKQDLNICSQLKSGHPNSQNVPTYISLKRGSL